MVITLNGLRISAIISILTFIGSSSVIMVYGNGIMPNDAKKNIAPKHMGGIHSHPGCLFQ